MTTTTWKTGANGLDASVLEANLSALARTSPSAVQRIRGVSARGDVEFLATDEAAPGWMAGTGGKVLSAQMGSGAGAKALASRRRPMEEASRLADQADVKGSGCIVVSGFGLGYHVERIARRMGRAGIVLVLEPDVGLLRAVLERIDHSSWLKETNVAVLTDADDAALISQTIRGMEEIMALGVSLVSHPPSRERIADAADRFHTNVARLVEAVKMSVVTTMVQVDVTIRNITSNIDRYVSCPGIGELKDAAKGKPAIVVAAGPSLRRNIDLLRDPAVRSRFVVIAVQTVLKQLLARGIKPDYVTALDYHEISRRFYEGLTGTDVEGVTLVAEPKANPAILDAFPGNIRCVGDGFLDELLGTGLRQEDSPHAWLTPGATVAHLAYYLARHLGCDPVVLIGQDLGFTDGQYYAAGAAIHDVWAGELNPFNTLEMMEWQRIARMRANLRKATDTLGREMYTDEQMNTYLSQFERDFKADSDRGLAIIDATEGGVAKRYTAAKTLHEVIAGFAGSEPTGALPVCRGVSASTMKRTCERLKSVRRDVWKVSDASKRAAGLLREMLEHHADQVRVNRLIEKVNAIRGEVTTLQPAYGLVHRLNQTGAFRRLRADRDMLMNESLSPMELQRRQIERDIDNVTWLGDAADELGRILDEAAAYLPREAGGEDRPKRTREAAPKEAEREVKRAESATGTGREPAVVGGESRSRRVVAVIPVLARSSGLGLPRDLSAPLLLGENPLRLTLRRLARCTKLDGVVLLARDVAEAERLAGKPDFGLQWSIAQADLSGLESRLKSVRAARLWGQSSWRGGLGGMTCYDEVLVAPAMAEALARVSVHSQGSGGAAAALVVGCDWCLVDPALCDAAIERYKEQPPPGTRPCFTQAPPGLAGIVMPRGLLDTLTRAWEGAGVWASVGGLLGYNPAVPILDLVGQQSCAPVDAIVRDTLVRMIPDAGPRRSMIAAALGPLGARVIEADAAEIAALVAERAGTTTAGDSPQQLVMELCTGRRTSGRRAHWERGSIGFVERAPMSRSLAKRVIEQLADAAPGGPGRVDAALMFGGAGDPLLHPEALEIVGDAVRAGIGAVHVRTDLLCDEAMLTRLIESGVDVISVDVMAETAGVYKSVMGIDRLDAVRRNVEMLLELRARRGATAGGLPTPWIVPRITRCDHTYGDIEAFYDRWLRQAGAAVIDSLPLAIPGERIAPLPKPRSMRLADLRRRMTVFSDGSVPTGELNLHATGHSIIGNAGKESLAALWRKLTQRRRDLLREAGEGHPDLQMGY